MNDVANPMPPLRAAECYLALGRLNEAESGAQAALHWAGDGPGREAARARAELILDTIRRRRHASP
jgi:hypothetical protein